MLAAVDAGDHAAAWELWQRHADELYALCFAEMNRHRADAEDALAQAMLKAIAQLPRFASGIVCVGAWLRRLTLNVCRDIHRDVARSRSAEATFDVAGEVSPDAALEIDPCDASALAARLPARLHEVFVLRVFRHMRYVEIAARLQVSPAAARKRMQEARALMNEWRQGREPPPARPPAPARRGGRQRMATLRAYIERHPRGWKKRLALADLLYESGAWAEALEAYRLVIHNRPWLTAIELRIQELEKFT